MTLRKRFDIPRRNDRCPCGSGLKFKKCCAAGAAPAAHVRSVGYIDDGEEAARWVITNARGTSFFSDKANKILVFTDKAVAFAIANMSEFSNQESGEINVAAVGASKFKHLCEILPYVEVSDVATGVELVLQRIEARQKELSSAEGTEDGNQAQNQSGASRQAIEPHQERNETGEGGASQETGPQGQQGGDATGPGQEAVD